MELKMGKEVLPHFSKFKYLGSILHNEVEINKDATHRIYAGWLKGERHQGLFVTTLHGTSICPTTLDGGECGQKYKIKMLVYKERLVYNQLTKR